MEPNAGTDDREPQPVEPSGAPNRVTKQDLVSRARNAGRPGLAALLENVFRVDIDGERITFWLDPSRENLIPLFNSNVHRAPLHRLLKEAMGKPSVVEFGLATDPNVAQARAQVMEAEAFVRSNPTVQFTLDLFDGKIVQCVPISQEKEELDHGHSGPDEPSTESSGEDEA